MSVIQWVVVVLALILVLVIAVGSAYIAAEKKKHEKALNEIKQKEAENAQRKADILTAAEKIKNDANSGNHSSDIDTMAKQLREFADNGK